MTIVIDSRSNKSNRSSDNRRKFLNRVRGHIKKAIPNIVSNEGVKDLTKEHEVGISKNVLSEPSFTYKSGEEEKYILPGNEEHVRGDKIEKEQKGNSKGSSGSPEDDGSQDNFIIRLTREEFLNYFFEDLELPDLVKKSLLSSKNYERKNAGYAIDGPPGRLAIVKSLKTAYIRRLALQGSYKKRLKELEENEKDEDWEIEKEYLEKKIKKIPFIDTLDMRYRNSVKELKPTTSAVIFSITDCSGSMDESKKLIARKFFSLLYLFLIRKYETIELVWVIHTAEARQVSEKEFFETQDSGGTVVSTALSLVYNLIQTKYGSTNSNLYILQSSDGDNFELDNELVSEYLDKLLPLVQFFGYIQIDNAMFHITSSNMLEIYQKKAEIYKNLQAKKITNEKEIWPIFRSLFEKENGKVIS